MVRSEVVFFRTGSWCCVCFKEQGFTKKMLKFLPHKEGGVETCHTCQVFHTFTYRTLLTKELTETLCLTFGSSA